MASSVAPGETTRRPRRRRDAPGPAASAPTTTSPGARSTVAPFHPSPPVAPARAQIQVRRPPAAPSMPSEIGRGTGLLAAAAVGVGSFLPWTHSAGAPDEITAYGLDLDGAITLGVAALVVITLLVHRRLAHVVGLIASAWLLVVAGGNVRDVRPGSDVAYGLWIVVCASAFLAAVHLVLVAARRR